MTAENALNFRFNDENKRLAELYSFKILDTPPEVNFDELAKLASSICDTPVGCISMVDAERIWFKSSYGLMLEEIPRKNNFCSIAIEASGVFEVPDTRLDSRFAKNPFVTGHPNIRFYAGAPLVSPRGVVLGVLCVMDFKPNKLTQAQAEALQVLAVQVVGQMETLRLGRSIAEAQKLIQSQHEIIRSKAKLEGIGIMAGKICNQINHPLDMCSARVALMRSRLSGETLQQKDVIDQDMEHLDRTINEIFQTITVFQRTLQKLRS